MEWARRQVVEERLRSGWEELSGCPRGREGSTESQDRALLRREDLVIEWLQEVGGGGRHDRKEVLWSTEPTDRETAECPVGRLRGGQAAHLMREGFCRRQPGERERGPGHGDGRGQPGRRSRWRGRHRVEGKVGGHLPARPRVSPADGRGMLGWAGSRPRGSQEDPGLRAKTLWHLAGWP